MKEIDENKDEIKIICENKDGQRKKERKKERISEKERRK